MSIASLSPVERLSHVIVNLGLINAFRAGELTGADGMEIIACIRGADKHAAKLGEPPFPWSDEQIMDRLVLASKQQAGVA